jgi:REP element-mobilizing transposase RayT
MARQVRVEYKGALCHVMARGNQGQSIVVDDLDRLVWLETLAEGCEKTGWKFHADVLVVNHHHLLLEMPGGNLTSPQEASGQGAEE